MSNSNRSPMTRNYKSMFDISSLLQKSIRRRDANMAYYAANELIPKYRTYLWKRLLTVSAEDCFDMVTGQILKLCKTDKNQSNPTITKNVAVAVSILLNARKNRDADFFACNLLNSRDTADITKYVASPIFDITCSTKNGHCITDLAEVFRKAIDAGDDEMAGYAANELRVYYRQFTWRTIYDKAKTLGSAMLTQEVHDLWMADKETQEKSTIFYAKAVLLMLKVVKHGDVIFNDNFRYNDNINLSIYDNLRLQIPDYVYDVHTARGKSMGKTRQQFVAEEQAALTPLQIGDYDYVGWDHFFWLCENGFYREDYTPHPSKQRVAEIESGIFQNTLF